MPKKKLAIFDMDGTLVDTKDVNFYAYKEALEDSSAEELKEQIDEFMQQYANEEIDGDTYAQKMMELTTSAQNDNNLV